MSFGMKRHRQELRLMTEMNVTNLLDTAFILLMAFMIVAPAIKHGIDLDLPVVDQATIDAHKTFTVVIQERPSPDAQDRVYLEDQRYSVEELTEELKQKKELFPEMDVVIEADVKVQYGTVALTLAAIKNAGIENVGLITEPETR